MCYIPSLFASFCYFLLFFEDLAVMRIYRIKIYYKDNQFLFLVGFFITLWLGGFFCCISSPKFLLIFLFQFWWLSSLSFISLGLIILSLSHLPFLDYLTPSCVRFLNYFREGEETFCSLNVFFSWGVPEWGWIEAGVGILGNFLFFFLMCWW